ncbi:MAG: hypothetical protein JW712_01805 [Dehalococcoidales bacterium]|nr:hypothetical protein [Dehalococcoidales bacterium]
MKSGISTYMGNIKQNVRVLIREKSLLLIIILVLSLGFGSYVCWHFNENDTFKLDAGIAHFQFNHPSNLEVQTVIVSDNIEITMSQYSYSYLVKNNRMKFNEYSIRALPRNYSFNEDKNDFLVLLNNRMDDYTNTPYSKGIKISRDEISIDGNLGLRDIHSYTSSTNQTTFRIMIIFYCDRLEWMIVNQFTDSIQKESLQIFDNLINSWCFIDDTTQDSQEQNNATFRLTEGRAHFSFGYSDLYNVDVYQLDEIYTLVPTSVYMTSPVSRYGENEDFTKIEIEVYKPEVYSNANAFFSSKVNQLSKSIDFAWLSRDVVKISNIDADWLECSYLSYSPRRLSWYPANGIYDYFGSNSLTTPLQTMKDFVVFDYCGLIWTITMESNAATYKIDRANFNQILKSFKILN